MVEFTDLNGNCPNPSEVITNGFKEFAKETAKFVCEQSAENKKYVDGLIEGVDSKLDALEDIPGILTKLSELNDFFNSVDPDGDGAINAVQALQDKLDKLTEQFSSLTKRVDKNGEDITAVNQRVSNLETTTTTALNSQNERITNTEGAVKNAEAKSDTALDTARNSEGIANQAMQSAETHEGQVSDLQTRIDEIISFDAELAQEIKKQGICKIGVLMQTGLAAALLAIKEEYGKGCPVDDAPANDAPADDAPADDAPADDVPTADVPVDDTPPDNVPPAA